MCITVLIIIVILNDLNYKMSFQSYIFVSVKETNKAKMNDLKENLFPEDKAIVAVKHEVHIKYVEMILRGKRAVRSKKAKAVMAALELLACENIAWRSHKQNLLAA